MAPQRLVGLLWGIAAGRRSGASALRKRPFPRARLLTLAVLTVATCMPAGAQGPEGYSLPHLFAIPTATTARQFGMGGVSSCVQDIGFPNPAFAGALTRQQAGVRAYMTEFDGGLDLTGIHGWYATPIGEGEGIQVLGIMLDSNQGNFMTPGGPVPGSIEETDAAVHYGRRLSERWLVGVGVSPLLETEVNLYHPVDGSVVMHTDSQAKLGGRVGTLYQWAPEGFVGFVFDWYTEDVTFQTPALPGPASFDFTSTEWALGVSARLGDRVLAAVEWMELESRDDAMVTRTDGLHVGLEFQATDQFSARLGSNDGAMSLGAGAQFGDWVVNYAYINDWNDASVGASLGGSDTHQLEVGRYW